MEAKSDETKAEKCFIMLHGAYNAYGLRNRGEKPEDDRVKDRHACGC